jgi:metallophosphoesterase superfamily enzyme
MALRKILIIKPGMSKPRQGRNLCRTQNQNISSSVGAAYSDVAPTELVILGTIFLQRFHAYGATTKKGADGFRHPRF